MSDSFREITGTTTNLSYATQMRDCLERKIRMGNDGIDLNSVYEGRRAPRKVTRSFSMSDDVFDLGVNINKRGIAMDYRLWAAWMTDTLVTEKDGTVWVTCQSEFFSVNIEKALGYILKQFFNNKPIRYIVDTRIKSRVES